MARVLKSVVKTQSRRQSVLVCSLLVVSIMLSAAVGEECVQGILPAETINVYGPSASNGMQPFTSLKTLYAFPLMNFSCSGNITDIRMRMRFVPGLTNTNISQDVAVYFLLFHDGLNSLTRRVTHILLNQTNTRQELPNEIWTNSDPLSLPVTEGSFIGLAVPGHRSPTMVTKPITLLPASVGLKVEAHTFQIDVPFDEFEGRMLEAAQTGDVCRLKTQMILLPLVDVSFNMANSSTTLPSSPRLTSTRVCTSVVPSHSLTPTSTSTPPPKAAAVMPSQLVTIIIPVVVSAVLILVVVGLVVAMVAVVCRRRNKDELNFKHYPRSNEADSKPVTANLALPNAISNPLGDERAGTQEVLHSPTTGQLKKVNTAPSGDGIMYDVPMATLSKQETGVYKTLAGRTYDTVYRQAPMFVPTMDERAQYTNTAGLLDHYALPEMMEGSQHYEFPSTESELYWCPADTEPELYRQLSQHKYQEIPRSTVIQDGQIGEGEFGVVCRGEWQNKAGVVQQVAVKTLHSEGDKVKFLQEAAAMGQFNHPHVARLFGVVTVGKPAMIVLELLEKGDLRSYLLTVDPSKHYNLTSLLLKFSRQITDGMAHLSSKNFIHRDLAARNILLDKELNCKIADFGMSRDLTNEYYLSQGGRIPLKWTAPEALLYHKYSTGSDVWSYGMVLFEIWSLGHKPFEEETAEQLVEMFSTTNGYCQAPPPGCPREVYAVMVDCWNPNHRKRPRFSEVFAFLSRPETVLTSFGEKSDLNSVPPTALVLGSPLDAAKNLYLDLQHTYTKKKK